MGGSLTVRDAAWHILFEALVKERPGVIADLRRKVLPVFVETILPRLRTILRASERPALSDVIAEAATCSYATLTDLKSKPKAQRLRVALMAWKRRNNLAGLGNHLYEIALEVMLDIATGRKSSLPWLLPEDGYLATVPKVVDEDLIPLPPQPFVVPAPRAGETVKAYIRRVHQYIDPEIAAEWRRHTERNRTAAAKSRQGEIEERWFRAFVLNRVQGKSLEALSRAYHADPATVFRRFQAIEKVLGIPVRRPGRPKKASTGRPRKACAK